MYHGTLNGSSVCIKCVRVYTSYGPQKAAKVCSYAAASLSAITNRTRRPSVKRL